MAETVGPVPTCGRELLRGCGRPIGLMVGFMIFTASVCNILDTPSYLLSPAYYIIPYHVPLHSFIQINSDLCTGCFYLLVFKKSLVLTDR
jgi:hypothetical protein